MLQLRDCPQMLLKLDFLESLVGGEIEGCGKISLVIFQSRDWTVTHLEQVELDTEQLPYFFTYSHASLESLTLLGTSKIKCLPDQMQCLTALRTLMLQNFDGLEALWFGHLSSLDELQIW